MQCPLCRRRAAKRRCPALAQLICPVCCATKRTTEIDCPADCAYLAVARAHPAAVVRRQQEQDVAVLWPTIEHLTERQYQLFFLFQTAIAQHRPETLSRLVDSDVVAATEAVAATLETASRGVIYEHQPASVPAQRLAADLKAVLAQARDEGARIFDAEAAVALRAIEVGARTLGTATGSGESGYLTLMERLLRLPRRQDAASLVAPGDRSLILP